MNEKEFREEYFGKIQKYPDEVQEIINYLKSYRGDPHLNVFHSFHIYPLCLAYPNGYYDSCLFEIAGYNENNHTRRIFHSKHDSLDFSFLKISKINELRIFADKSTFISFSRPVMVSLGQRIYLKDLESEISCDNLY